MEYHSFLWMYITECMDYKFAVKFPSPYGVSFILINKIKGVKNMSGFENFPSPYGVSFILIIKILGGCKDAKH